jgi:ribosomal protein L21
MIEPLTVGRKVTKVRLRVARLQKRQAEKMFAVIETGGKQYKVQYGDVIYVEKLAANEDETVTFPVVAICGEDGTKIGTPYVEGASVTGKVLKNGKAKKVTILTYKPKKGEKRKMGHRQPYTKIQIESVQG